MTPPPPPSFSFYYFSSFSSANVSWICAAACVLSKNKINMNVNFFQIKVNERHLNRHNIMLAESDLYCHRSAYTQILRLLCAPLLLV